MYDTGASINVISKHFSYRLQYKPKLISCNRSISSTGGEASSNYKIGKRTFQDRVITIENVRGSYILGQLLHRNNRFGTGYSITCRQYITINGEMIAQSILQATNNPILRTKGKVTLPPMSVSVVEIKMPRVPNTKNLYELNLIHFSCHMESSP